MDAPNQSSGMQYTSTNISGVATETNGHGSQPTTANTNSLATETSGPNVLIRSQVTICNSDAITGIFVLLKNCPRTKIFRKLLSYNKIFCPRIVLGCKIFVLPK